MRLGVAAALVGGRRVPGDVEVEGDRIAAVGLAGAGSGLAAPGLVDLQVNGFAGVDLSRADRDGYERAGRALLAGGTTAYQPTFITAPEPDLLTALRTLPLDVPGAQVLGAHLEGPFISARRLGAHPAGAQRAPDPALLDRLLAAGPVRHVTLAPELPGAPELIDALVARGVVVAAGHTDATAAEAHAAFDRGVRTVTHLFNAMRPPAARDPGIALAALARPDVTVQLIADGVHLADETLLVAWHAARGRVCLVSDAVAVAGTGAGAEPPRGPDGRLAGSAIALLDAVRHVHGLGVSVEAALTAASAVPARIAGRPELGRLAPGTRADVIVLDDALRLVRVLAAGAERGAG